MPIPILTRKQEFTKLFSEFYRFQPRDFVILKSLTTANLGEYHDFYLELSGEQMPGMYERMYWSDGNPLLYSFSFPYETKAGNFFTSTVTLNIIKISFLTSKQVVLHTTIDKIESNFN